jgi:arabinose-5-phosphate isomerase
MADYLENARALLRSEAEAIAGLEKRIDANFDKVLEVLFTTKGKVIVTGVGKSGHIGHKIAGDFFQ